jgi:hypothetical protein
MWFAFAGFLITRPNIPPWWKWFSYLCPPAWNIYAIVVDQLADKVCPPEMPVICASRIQLTKLSGALPQTLSCLLGSS